MGKPGPDPSVSPPELVRAIVSNRKPAVATSEIADTVDLSRQATRRHLDRMEDDGLLYSGKTGPTTVWWPTEAGRQLLAP
jgi:predicted ArsR family transcriptional regulator